MVLLTLSSKLNKAIAPLILRHGLTLRLALGGGVIRDNPLLDSVLLLPLSQKLLSLEIHQAGDPTQSKEKPSALEKMAEESFDRIFGPDQVVTKSSRMQALEQYLRPVLVPNEQWSDVHRWMFHSRFVKFARAEYLKAEYDLKTVMEKYPKLRRSPQVAFSKSLEALMGGAAFDKTEKMQSTTLPSTKSVRNACGMKGWSQTKDTDAIWNRMNHLAKQLDGQVVAIPGTSLRIPMLDDKTDTSNLSVEDILELAGGHVASCGPFNVLCEECDIYQLWSKEYIDILAHYLLDRSSDSTVILDIGAGDGMLAQLVRERMAESTTNAPQVVAIDDGSWKIRSKCPVEKISAEKALDTYGDDGKSVIVLCSWMPMGQDWTALFRANNVEEYILIGEYDDGNCGDNWETWGNPEFAQDEKASKRPPYQGYNRVELTDLALHQFSRFDSQDSTNSATISFRRR